MPRGIRSGPDPRAPSTQSWPERANALSQLRKREVLGLRKGCHSCVRRRDVSHFLPAPLSGVLPRLEDRSSIVILGFSADGEHVVGYFGNEILFWPLVLPRLGVSVVSDHKSPITVPPSLRFRLPGPPIAPRDSDLSDPQHCPPFLVSMVPSGRLAAVFSNENESKDGATTTLRFCPLPGKHNCWVPRTDSLTTCSASESFYSHASCGRHFHHFMDVPTAVPGARQHLLLVNCGESLRVFEVVTAFPGEVPTCPGDVTDNVRFASSVQLMPPHPAWWSVASDRADMFKGRPAAGPTAKSSPFAAVAEVQKAATFEIEPFLNELLGAQLRRKQLSCLDFYFAVVDPLFRPPGRATAGRHILLSITAEFGCRSTLCASRIASSSSRGTAPSDAGKKRARTGSVGFGAFAPPPVRATSSTMVGVVVSLEWETGVVAVLRSVKLEEKPAAKYASKTPHAAGEVDQGTALARLASRFTATVRNDRGLVVHTRDSHQPLRCTVLSNAAKLRGESLPFLANPLFPVAIRPG